MTTLKEVKRARQKAFEKAMKLLSQGLGNTLEAELANEEWYRLFDLQKKMEKA